MSFYTNMQATASRLLTKFGQDVTITYAALETYTVATQTNAKTTSTFTGKGVLVDYNTSEIDDETVLAKDRRLILESTSRAPMVDDTVTVNSTVYRVMAVEEVTPAATNVIYICQLRI